MEQHPWSRLSDRVEGGPTAPARPIPRFRPALIDAGVLAQPGTCGHCSGQTYWIEYNFLGYLHPGRCTESTWREYAAAMRE